MRTSELAARAAVNVETLRYYERRGLLSAPERSVSGYRSWPADAVRAVRFVKHAQEVGFTLADVEALLHVHGAGPEGCASVRGTAHARLDDMERQIAELQARRDALAHLVRACERPHDPCACPLLSALDALEEASGGEPS